MSTAPSSGWQPIRRGHHESAPLAFGQRSLWFLNRWRPDAATYNIPWVLRPHGPVDAAVLARSLDAVVQRHAALRTVFSGALGEPRQIVRSDVVTELPVVDAADEDAARQEIAAAARRPFDLEEGPLVRAELVRWAPDRAALVVVFHHIVCDEWSLEVFEHELTELYRAEVEGRMPRLDPPRVQYADHTAWQHETWQGERLERGLAYWERRLAGAPQQLELPYDRPRPSVQSFAGGTVGFTVPADVAGRVRELAAAAGVTPYMVLLTSFAALLHRYTGQDDLVIGTPVAGRDRPEVERLIGYFVNMLPVRAQLTGSDSFASVLERVRDAAFADLEHHDVPFDLVVDRLVERRPTDRNPLFQVLFGMRTEQPPTGQPVTGQPPTGQPPTGQPPTGQPPTGQPPTGQPATGGLGDVEIGTTGTAKFDLGWQVSDDGRRLGGHVEYSTDLFDVTTVRRMVGHWQRLLAAATERPETSVAALPLLSDAELEALTPSPPVLRGGRCLHRWFEDVARARPDALAVVLGRRRWTYRELDARANRLAHHLRNRGVRPGDRVGLLLDRGPRQVEAILAVLKCGAAYVPSDVTSPAERIALVLTDAAVRTVVTDRPGGPPSGPWDVVDLPSAAAEIAACSDDAPDVRVDPEQEAYVIFTSGSTGRPKGVEVTHANVAELLRGSEDPYAFGPDDVWTLFHSYAFDFSVWEIWGALLYGGRLVVVPYQVSRSPEAFARLLQDEGVTVLNQTPTAFAQLTGALQEHPRRLDRLRWIVFAGEALRPAHVRNWYRTSAAPGARLCNMYGITETTVHTTVHVIDGPDGFDRSIIGRPMPHLTAVVLDPSGRPVPVGAPGELYVGGGGVARGYAGRPATTAERFLPDPAAARPGDRRYRSGDLARQRPDGTLEYLGRIDDQVKIRGFRIELGEIQHHLDAHPAVRTSAVVIRPTRSGDPRIIAYAVPDDSPRDATPVGAAPADAARGGATPGGATPGGATPGGATPGGATPGGATPGGRASGGGTPDVTELRRHLGERLPDYMLPAVIMVVPSLPMTANGKVDVRALPEPAATRASTVHEPPRGPAETALAEIWHEVLGVERIGRGDGFFELGGDSIRSVQVVGLARRRGYGLRLDDLFTTPTLAAAATRLTALTGATDDEPETRPFALLDPADRASLASPDVIDAYPMTDLQLSMVYHLELDPDHAPYRNVNSYRIAGPLDEAAFAAAVARAVERHPTLRTSFDLGSYAEPTQIVHASAPVPVVFGDLSHEDEAAQHAAIAALVEREHSTPFPLDRPPLLRIDAQRLGPDAFQLTLAEHHAILDGWSFTTLLAELLATHERLRRDPAAAPPPPPPARFRDFVALERAASADEESLAFWRRRLAGMRGSMLGTSSWSAGNDAGTGGRRTDRPLPPELCRRMARLAASAGVGLKSVALAAHVAALADVTGRDTVVTGLTVNGRVEDAAGVAALGLFLNVVPLRVGTGGHGSWLALVRDLHRQEAEAMPHRRVPFARLARLMADPHLDVSFTFNRFHALGGAAIVDDVIGVAPTLRREPNHFGLSVGFVQDPASDRALLTFEHTDARISLADARAYADRYLAAAEAMTADPEGVRPRWANPAARPENRTYADAADPTGG
ncbi:amino acid adenylation domain-containing protein [Actinomadura gamaensis]|uniref:Amino acid adenylation domain-containing protein n=1 Tax=Actinomadura gamaensis TaxID=1763541 RepID=A0ABV9TYB2_9ACTN